MKVRSALATIALTALIAAGGAASADAATPVNRHINKRASYYDKRPANTIVHSWHGVPVNYVDNSSGQGGYSTCIGTNTPGQIYVTEWSVKAGIAFNVVRHEYVHILGCRDGDWFNPVWSPLGEQVADAGAVLQGAIDTRKQPEKAWRHAKYLLNKYRVTG